MRVGVRVWLLLFWSFYYSMKAETEAIQKEKVLKMEKKLKKFDSISGGFKPSSLGVGANEMPDVPQRDKKSAPHKAVGAGAGGGRKGFMFGSRK